MIFGKGFTEERVPTISAEINLVQDGSWASLLLLYGCPQTHVIWREVATQLKNDFHVSCPDLCGYGDSAKPSSADDHSSYSTRVVAQDEEAYEQSTSELLRFFGGSQ